MSELQEHFRDVLRTTSDIQGHLKKLHRFVLELHAQRVLELGVRRGMSTVVLLAALEHTGGHLWSVDKDPPHRTAQWMERIPHWTFILEDDRNVDFTAVGDFDLLFIDTSHELSHTQYELKTFGPLVRSGGYIVGHDWELMDVAAPFIEHQFTAGAKLEAWPEDHGLVRLRLP